MGSSGAKYLSYLYDMGIYVLIIKVIIFHFWSGVSGIKAERCANWKKNGGADWV